MTVEKLRNLEKVVKPILEQCPKAREDDYLLYAEVLRVYNPELLKFSINFFLRAHNKMKAPNIKSVERARRKVQEKFPELATERSKRKRAEEQASYISYSHDKT